MDVLLTARHLDIIMLEQSVHLVLSELVKEDQLLLGTTDNTLTTESEWNRLCQVKDRRMSSLFSSTYKMKENSAICYRGMAGGKVGNQLPACFC